MENTIYSLIPPVLAILMVILTRRVLLSLGIGIIASAFLLSEFHIVESITMVWNAVQGIFISAGALNASNVYILLFLLLLGMITAFISITGGSRAFGKWAMNYVKTRVGAKLIGFILGLLLFIDDYFNALAVGQVTRPITDRHKVSRAKLAYIIDSTSAPICVISPISSWGATIILLIGTVLTTHGVTEYSAFTAFMLMVPMNFYVLAALSLVFIVIVNNYNFGPMRIHEDRAIKEGLVYDRSKPVPGEMEDHLPTSHSGKIGDLLWPIITLFVGTVGTMFWTGAQAVEGNPTLLQIFEQTDVSLSLLMGGVLSFLISILMFFRQSFIFKSVDSKVFVRGIVAGMKSMMPAIYILIFAWTIGDLIGQLGTGTYLANLVDSSSISVSFIPFLLFLIAGFMAFATGTSWGSFGILIPIAGEMAAVTDLNMLLPCLAAVLAGAVFGDHASPISDTTILSSTGAGSNIIDHVMTQLPYAVTSAGIAALGYAVIGFTGSAWTGLIVVLALIISIALFVGHRTKNSNSA